MSDDPMAMLTEGLQNIADQRARHTAEATAGCVIALIAVLQKLAATGVLPSDEAKAAIDGVYEPLTDANKKSGAGMVLRQISGALDTSRPTRQ